MMEAPDRIWINWTPADAENFPTAVGATTVLSHINTMAYPVEYHRTAAHPVTVAGAILDAQIRAFERGRIDTPDKIRDAVAQIGDVK